MDQLKPIVSRYLEVTKKLNEVNSAASDLRDERRSVELDLAAVYAETGDALPEKIDLKNSQMMFYVKKPGQWKKGWTLSKKQLEEYLHEILPEHGENVMQEIIRRHEPKLTATDFAFDLKRVT